MRFPITILVLLVLVLAACVRSDYSPLVQERFPPTDPNSVKMFITQKPEREYLEIGIVEADGPPLASRSKLVNEIRRLAAKMGAHAVIVGEIGNRITGAVFTGAYSATTTSRKTLQGVAIRWK